MRGAKPLPPGAGLALLAAAFALAACGPVPKDVARRGEALYLAHCAECHGAEGEGQDARLPLGRIEPDLPMLAPALNGAGHCSDHSPRALFELIRDGTAVPGSPMPHWGARFSDADIAALVGYLFTRWPRPLRQLYEARHGGELRSLMP